MIKEEGDTQTIEGGICFGCKKKFAIVKQTILKNKAIDVKWSCHKCGYTHNYVVKHPFIGDTNDW
jgi:RNase P subunit RPR2